MKRAIALAWVLVACNSAPYHQDLMSDGRTWRVSLKHTFCTSGDQQACLDKLKTDLTPHAEEICNGKTFRFFSCHIKSYNAKGECLLACEAAAESKGPSSK